MRLCLWLALATACGQQGLRERTLPVTQVLARGRLVYDVALDAAGLRVASVELDARGFELWVRALPSGQELLRTHLSDTTHDVVDVAVDSSGHQIAVACLDGTVRLLSDTGTTTVRLEAAATAVALSADAATLATGTAQGVLCLRRTRDHALLQCTRAHERRVSSLAFSPDGKTLASAGWDGHAVVWASPSLAELQRRSDIGTANAVAFSPDGTFLAVARSRVVPVRTPEFVRRERDLGAARIDPFSHVELWDLGQGTSRTLRGHGAPVVTVAFTPDGRSLLSGSWDRQVILWDVATGDRLAHRAGFAHLVRALAITPDGSRAVVASWAERGEATLTVLELPSPSP